MRRRDVRLRIRYREVRDSLSSALRECLDELERRKDSAFRMGDFGEHDRLVNEQARLGDFRPIMTHSVEEAAGVVVFHGQLLSVFKTVDLIATKMLEELDPLVHPDVRE